MTTGNHGDDSSEREEKQQDSYLAGVARLTRELRSSGQPRWERVRNRLEREGIAPEDAVLATLHPEDVNLEFGIIVTRRGRAFAFELDFLRDEEGRDLSYEDAFLSSWEELDEIRRPTYARELELGRSALASESP